MSWGGFTLAATGAILKSVSEEHLAKSEKVVSMQIKRTKHILEVGGESMKEPFLDILDTLLKIFMCNPIANQMETAPTDYLNIIKDILGSK